MKEKIIQVGDIKVFTRIAGQGNPFLILHGWPATADSWLKVQEKLSPNFTVYVIDMPGFGRSESPKEAWGLDEYCNFVLEFLKEEKLEKVYLLGHSFGGRIAIKLAVKHPEKIIDLILVAAAGVKHKFDLKTNLGKFLAFMTKRITFLYNSPFLRDLFYRKILRRTDYLKAKGIMKEIFKEVLKEDLAPYFSRILSRTLLVWGNNDKFTPLKDGVKMSNCIPNSKLEIIPSAGHTPHLLKSGELVGIINKFILKDGC